MNEKNCMNDVSRSLNGYNRAGHVEPFLKSCLKFVNIDWDRTREIPFDPSEVNQVYMHLILLYLNAVYKYMSIHTTCICVYWLHNFFCIFFHVWKLSSPRKSSRENPIVPILTIVFLVFAYNYCSIHAKYGYLSHFQLPQYDESDFVPPQSSTLLIQSPTMRGERRISFFHV